MSVSLSAVELAAILSPLCTVAVAFVGRTRLQAVEKRVDGSLDAHMAELNAVKRALVEARLSPAEKPPLDLLPPPA